MHRIAVLLFALVLAACASTPPPPPPIADQMSALQRRLFLIVEERRQRLDERVVPLRLDPQLVAAAQAHADAMAKAHEMDGRNGAENPAMKALIDDPKFQGFVAETVGQQFYFADRGIDVDKFAQSLLDLWLNSEKHKWTVSFWGFNRTGIGVATDGKAIFISQVFSTDLGLPPPPDAPVAAPPASPPVPAPKP